MALGADEVGAISVRLELNDAGFQQQVATDAQKAAKRIEEQFKRAGQTAGTQAAQGFGASFKALEAAAAHTAQIVRNRIGPAIQTVSSQARTGFGSVTASINKVHPAIDALRQKFRTLTSGSKDLNSSLAGVGVRLAGVGLRLGSLTPEALAGAAALAAFAASVKLVSEGISAAANVERIETALKGIFQLDTENAENAFRQIQEFAAATPFSLETANNAVLKLKATFDSLSVEGALTVLQQIAAAGAAIHATDDQLNRAILAITQIGAAGKLTADNLRQLTEALPGISRVKITENLATALGKTVAEVQKLQDTGGITADQGIAAILDTIGQIPGITDALENQAATFQGLISTLRDTITQFLSEAAKPLLEAFKDFIPVIADVLKSVGPQLKVFFVNIGNSIKILLPTMAVFFRAFASLAAVISTLLPIVAFLISRALSPITKSLLVLTPIVNILSSAFTFLTDTIIDAVSAILGPLRRVVEFASKIPGVGRVVKALGGDFASATSDIKVFEGSVDDAKKALEKLPAVFRDIKKGFEESLGAGGLLGGFNELRKLIAGNNEFLQQAADTVSKTLDDFDSIIVAQRKLSDATNNVQEAQAKYNKLLAEGAVDLEKVADATEALAEARRRLDDATTDRIEAEEALNEAQKPASTDDLDEATDKLTLARIALREATEAAKKAEDELGDASGQTLNLAGKSLSQIKEILANARASAAARSKAAKDESKATKTAQQLADEALKQQIAIRDAAREVRDAEKKLQTVQAEGSDKDPAVLTARQALAQAREDEASATSDLVKAQAELNIARAGDVGFAEKLAGFAEDKRKAVDKEKDLQLELDALIANQLGNQEKILAVKLLQVDADRALLAAQPRVLESILRTLVQSLAGNIAGPGLTGPSLIDDIVNALINNPNSPFAEIFRQFGIPGFHAEGGMFTKPTLGIFGEAGREGIIPMTKPFRAAQILGKDPAWPAIAKHLQAMSPVALSKPLDSVPGIRVPARPGGGGGMGTGGKDTQEILKLLRQIAANQHGVTLNVEQKIEARGLDETVLARRAAQMLKKEFLRSL